MLRYAVDVQGKCMVSCEQLQQQIDLKDKLYICHRCRRSVKFDAARSKFVHQFCDDDVDCVTGKSRAGAFAQKPRRESSQQCFIDTKAAKGEETDGRILADGFRVLHYMPENEVLLTLIVDDEEGGLTERAGDDFHSFFFSNGDEFESLLSVPLSIIADEGRITAFAVSLGGNTKEALQTEAEITQHCMMRSQEGMTMLDEIHRSYLIRRDPATKDAPIMHITAPPGGGKTTLLLGIAKQWSHGKDKKKFLILTFSKSLEKELKHRISGEKLRNVDVKTVDSLCYCQSDGKYKRLNTKVNDRWLIESHYKDFCEKNRWYCMKGATGCASVTNRFLRSTCSVHDESLKLCKAHEACVRPILQSVCERDDDAEMRYTFSAYRRLAYEYPEKTNRLMQKYDCIMVDEVQDLNDQAKKIITESGLPTIFVGDDFQSIFDFADECTCLECDLIISGHSRCHDRDNGVRTFELYRSFRHTLDSSLFVRDVFPESTMIGAREGSIRIDVTDEIPRQNCLILCRSNYRVSIIITALQRESIGVRVVGGDATARRMKSIAQYLSNCSRSDIDYADFDPMIKFVMYLIDQNILEETVATFNNLSISLPDVKKCRCPCISTVHKIKGYEHPHIVIDDEFWWKKKDTDLITEEAKVLFVALTRHKERLTILFDKMKSYAMDNT